MKVRVFETVDIETEVDVSVQDVLNEFAERVDEAEQKNICLVKSAYLPLVDFVTQLMARVPITAIKKCTESQRRDVVARLIREAERWAVHAGDENGSST